MPNGHAIYAFRATFPDGDHILTHNCPWWPDADGKIPQRVFDNINVAISQNPDVKVRQDSLKLISNKPALLDEMIDALRSEEPNRPLANDLGLDKTNRLLTNPEISRGIAAAQGKTIGEEA
jgi:hypothetical protein